MGINADTKIDDLLKQYPFLEDFLVNLSPKFKGLKNPIMRKTIGKVATLSKIAGIGGLDLEDFLAALTKEIDRRTGQVAGAPEPATDRADDFISDPHEKQEALQEQDRPESPMGAPRPHLHERKQGFGKNHERNQHAAGAHRPPSPA